MVCLVGLPLELLIATANPHKVTEISRILGDYGVALRQEKIVLLEPDLGSLEKIAGFKARQAFEKIRRPVIAEDTGVFFEAYNDFPGVLAKRVFLGLGFGGLTALVRNAENKRAFFKTVICYFDGKAQKTFSGKLAGTLLDSPVSVEKDRLPYEKLFVPEGHSKALVDIHLEEKNRFSHRAQAARKLGEWLSKQK